jgi:hypothetical protein
LLILDNLEHLLPLDAEIDRLLTRDSNLSIIVVSRVPIHFVGAQEMSLPPP